MPELESLFPKTYKDEYIGRELKQFFYERGTAKHQAKRSKEGITPQA
jgi:hypothetical protein